MRPLERAARVPGIDQENTDSPAALKRRPNQGFLKRRHADAIARGDDQHTVLLRRALDQTLTAGASSGTLGTDAGASADLIPQIEREHRAAVGAAQTVIEHAVRCGKLLRQAKSSVPHGEWLPWIQANLSFGARQAQKYMRVAERADDLPNANSNSHLTVDEALSALAERDNSHFRTSFSGDNEWHTPAACLVPVRQVLNQIDLDPASNEIAQRQVCAASYYTKEDDGLTRPWHGKVFLNPPFAHPPIEQFIDKLLEELDASRVTEAIVLTNNFSDTRWFHKAARAATAICFTKGRVRFERPENDSAQPTQGQAFFYFGPQLPRFREAFAAYGLILLPDPGGAP